ncbi:unnamed protein product [Clonostachys chloroleuca]|uniref:4'-phosphopantetheinyl transferase domain-containing protein n=1 Tax=Clonostachys chloroleuca TaxID=1926264 RepID=A0AA35M414_9HYPO|nr:unnamed protein product [Clonostachys chloroleuca]
MRPLRAFPLPINVGTDICQISRIYRILEGPRAARFVDRILGPHERVVAASRLLPLTLVGSPGTEGNRDSLMPPLTPAARSGVSRDDELWKTAAFIAGRFAAKEAAIKAHSHRRLTFHDITIERRGRDEERLGSGPPVARIRGELGDDCDSSAMISISHDGDYATAVCIGHDPSVTSEPAPRKQG